MNISLKIFKRTIALFLSAIILLSCKDKTSKIGAITDDKNTPTLAIQNLVLEYTENGIIRRKVTAPIVERYLMTDEPYSVFPKGFHLKSYTADMELESEIMADYALRKEAPEESWKAVGNVVVINYLKQQTLKTDTLYWDRATRQIYTYAPAHIKLPDADTYAMHGLTADDRFENYEIRKAYDGHFIYNENGEPADSSAISIPIPDTAGIRPKYNVK